MKIYVENILTQVSDKVLMNFKKFENRSLISMTQLDVPNREFPWKHKQKHLTKEKCKGENQEEVPSHVSLAIKPAMREAGNSTFS